MMKVYWNTASNTDDLNNSKYSHTGIWSVQGCQHAPQDYGIVICIDANAYLAQFFLGRPNAGTQRIYLRTSNRQGWTDWQTM